VKGRFPVFIVLLILAKSFVPAIISLYPFNVHYLSGFIFAHSPMLASNMSTVTNHLIFGNIPTKKTLTSLYTLFPSPPVCKLGYERPKDLFDAADSPMREDFLRQSEADAAQLEDGRLGRAVRLEDPIYEEKH